MEKAFRIHLYVTVRVPFEVLSDSPSNAVLQLNQQLLGGEIDLASTTLSTGEYSDSIDPSVIVDELGVDESGNQVVVESTNHELS